MSPAARKRLVARVIGATARASIFVEYGTACHRVYVNRELRGANMSLAEALAFANEVAGITAPAAREEIAADVPQAHACGIFFEGEKFASFQAGAWPLVRDVFGVVHTVFEQRGNMLITDRGDVHRTKAFPVEAGDK